MWCFFPSYNLDIPRSKKVVTGIKFLLQMEQITKQLVNIAVDPTKETEARIGSYLAAMKCAKYEDLKKITNKISKEENTQGKSTLLS